MIDTKRYAGRPRLVVDGGILRPRVERLVVGRRECTKLVVSVNRQAEIVRAALGDNEIPVNGVLCFVDADWPLLGRPLQVRGVEVLWPAKLHALLQGGDRLTVDLVEQTATRLAQHFPPA